MREVGFSQPNLLQQHGLDVTEASQLTNSGLAWVRQGLAPTLRAGDVVILDNLSTHKIRGVREAIEATGARLLYRPPYSPDFNPIEPMWSKIKQILRGHDPRSEQELLSAAKTAFQSVSTADCKGFFFSAQYAT